MDKGIIRQVSLTTAACFYCDWLDWLTIIILANIWAIKAFKKGVLYHGEDCNRGPENDPPILEPAFLLVNRWLYMTYLLGCLPLARSLVSCQPSRCRCCCTMPKRSPAKRDFRDNGERKIKQSKESASSSTSKVDEDLVRYFCLFSVMAPLFTFSRIRGKLIWLLVQLFWNEKSV